MTFTTKKYTRPVLLSEVRKLNVSNFANFKSFASGLSPRAGARSAKVSAIRSLVTSRQLTALFNGGAVNAKKSMIALLK